MKSLFLPLLVCGVVIAVNAAEPVPRRPIGTLVKTTAPLPYISGVAELADGRLIVSDHKTPRLSMIVRSTGALSDIGSAGAAAGQFVRPGGFYGTADQGLWMLDRGLSRAVAVSPAGALGASHSVLPRGSSGSSNSDYDVQRLDGRGNAYYFNAASMRPAVPSGAMPPQADLVRVDPRTDQTTTVARLLQRLSQTLSGGDGMTLFRTVNGSPADGWGVAADGRVAVVRAAPYRVDWFSATGVATKGPVYPVDVLPMTDADKQAIRSRNTGRGGAAVGAATAPGSAAGGPDMLFAETKAPFDPERIMVSPTGRVLVPRSTPLEQLDVVIDVFDGRGQRIDRLQLPATSRVVGFGTASMYVREETAPGAFILKMYALK